MKVPEHIKTAIKRREKAAMTFTENDVVIANWCKQNGIELEECDINGGCESIVNPFASTRRILKAICDK